MFYDHGTDTCLWSWSVSYRIFAQYLNYILKEIFAQYFQVKFQWCKHSQPSAQICACLLCLLWITMDHHGPQWTAMDCHGPPWTDMYCHGPPWTTMDCHGPPWTAMAAMDCHGPRWTVMDWMDNNGLQWTVMDCDGLIDWFIYIPICFN